MKRGDVYWYGVKNDDVKHINKGRRPVLIVSNDKCNNNSPSVHAVPFTASIKKFLPTHVKVEMNHATNFALCEQVFLLNKDDIDKNNYICTLRKEEMDLISIALMKQLGIMEV